MKIIEIVQENIGNVVKVSYAEEKESICFSCQRFTIFFPFSRDRIEKFNRSPLTIQYKVAGTISDFFRNNIQLFLIYELSIEEDFKCDISTQ